MILTKTQKILLLIFTLIPSIILAVSLSMGYSPYDSLWLVNIIGLVSLAVFVVFTMHVYHNPSMSAGYKVFWVVMFIIFSTLASLVYWFIYVRSAPERS